MKGGRVFRVLFGVLLLAAFCFYFHNRYVTSPHSSDLTRNMPLSTAKRSKDWLGRKRKSNSIRNRSRRSR